MITFTDISVVAGMILLRVGVPALVVMALAYALKRLDLRWEAEAHEYQSQMASQQPEVQPEAPAPQPVAPARKPAKQPTPQPLPFIPPPAVEKEQRPGMYAQAGLQESGSNKSAWERKSCSGAVNAAYAATGLESQACWQARFKAEGQIPEECVSCDVFQRYPKM